MGATLGASAVFASAAQAATYTVTTNGDDVSPAACTGTPATQCATLRDAVTAADADSTPDTIVFANSLTGTITLLNGSLSITNTHGITVSGPGAGTLAVSGNSASQIFVVGGSPASSSVSDAINQLTLKNGTSSSSPGGAIDDTSSMPLSLTGDTITGSTSSNSGGGGGIAGSGPTTVSGSTISGNIASAGDGGGIAPATSTRLTITGTTISGNTALSGGGIGGFHSSSRKYNPSGPLEISGDSQITGNHATGTSGSGNGGGISGIFDTISVSGSVISGNDATNEGGGIFSKSQFGTTVSGSAISRNRALTGGGVGVSTSGTKYAPGYAPVTISTSTLSGNQATEGSGLNVDRVNAGNTVSVQASTISGNHGGASSFGGGIAVVGNVYGAFRLIDSTVSGNSATTGGGLSLGDASHARLNGANGNGSTGTISFDNSTIAANSASTNGGGIYLGQYSSGAERSGTADLRSTVVSGNTAHGAGQDLQRATGSTSGGFNGAFSLIQNPGTVPLTKQQVLVGVDPKLGPLSGNGGPTQTMLPSGTSPVIDQGRAFDDLQTDQRGFPRTVDTPIPNPPGGDGTDIGSVELPASSVVGIDFRVSIDQRALGGSARPLIAGRATPVLCSVRLTTIAGCVIKIRVGKKLIATGSATTTRPNDHIFLRVKLTSDGLAMLAGHPLGLKATAFALANAPGSPTLAGPVRLLAGPSITLPTGSRSRTLSASVLSKLDRAAGFLGGVRKVTCTAFTDNGIGDVSLTKAQAKAACKRLRKDGLRAKYHSVGGGNTRGGTRKLVISFKF